MLFIEGTPVDVPWRDFAQSLCDELKDGAEDVARRLKDALETATDMNEGRFLPPHFKECLKPYYETKRKRNAALHIALLHTLERRLSELNASKEVKADWSEFEEQLARSLHNNLHPVPPGLTMAAASTVATSATPFWLKVGRAIDAVRTKFGDAVHGASRDECWTSATAQIMLDYLARMAQRDWTELDKLLKSGVGMTRFMPTSSLHGTLPTDRHITVELHTSAWLAQLLKFDRNTNLERWHRRAFDIRDIGHPKSGGVTQHSGLNTLDIYLSVLIERINLQLPNSASTASTAPPAGPPAPAPSGRAPVQPTERTSKLELLLQMLTDTALAYRDMDPPNHRAELELHLRAAQEGELLYSSLSARAKTLVLRALLHAGTAYGLLDEPEPYSQLRCYERIWALAESDFDRSATDIQMAILQARGAAVAVHLRLGQTDRALECKARIVVLLVPPGQQATTLSAMHPTTSTRTQFAGDMDLRAQEVQWAQDLLDQAFSVSSSMMRIAKPDPAYPGSFGSIAPDPVEFQGKNAGIEWISVMLVVRENGLWRVIPTDFEDVPHDVWRMELTLPLLNAGGDRPDAERLFDALNKATWAQRRDGPGLFIAGALYLDTPAK